MKVFISLCLLLACAGPCPGADQAELPKFECERPPLLVRNVDVWSPEGVDRGRDVLVVDGHIRTIGTAGRVKAPKAARIIDGQSQLMTPGFVDAHVHFSFPGSLGERKGDPVTDALVFGRQLLASGVTSARVHLDTLTHGKLLADLARQECAPMPRLQVSGPAFIPGAGTGDQHPVWDVSGVDDAIAKVRREHALGFQWIAMHEVHKFPADARAAIVDTARQLGLRLLASGYTQGELASSLEIRPDSIDYLDVSTSPQYDLALLQRARQQEQLTWVARLGIHERYRAYQENPVLVDEPANYEFFDASTAEALRLAVRTSIADRASEHSKRMDGAYPTMRRKFEQLRASGIPLAVGTDVGSPAQFHRNAIWWEFSAWLRNGATRDEFLRAATSGGAHLLGLPQEGRLREQAPADFLLCPAQLLDSPGTDGRGCSVFKAGMQHGR